MKRLLVFICLLLSLSSFSQEKNLLSLLAMLDYDEWVVYRRDNFYYQEDLCVRRINIIEYGPKSGTMDTMLILLLTETEIG